MITKIRIDRGYVFVPSIQVVFRVDISGRPTLESMTKAIKAAVSKFDILNCRVLQDEESGECYYVRREVDTEPDIEIRHYHQDAQEFINEQEKLPFDLEQGKTQRYIIADDGDKITLNIVQHHLVGDGKSILKLIEEIMYNLQSIEENGKCVSENTEKVPVKVYTESYLKKYVELNPLMQMSIENLNSKWNETGKFFTFNDLKQLFNEYWKDRKTNVISATITEDVLDKMVSLCKRYNITVNNFIIALFAKSFKEKTKIGVAADLRTSEFEGMGNYVSCILIDALYDENMTFWQNAMHIQKLVGCQLVDKSQLMTGLLFKGSFVNGLQDGVYFQTVDMIHSSIIDEYNDLAGLGTEGIPLCISNIGKNALRENYGKFKIEKISFFSPVSPGLNSNMGVITVNGKMVLNLMYNDKNAGYASIFNEVIGQIFEMSNKTVLEERQEYCLA